MKLYKMPKTIITQMQLSKRKRLFKQKNVRSILAILRRANNVKTEEDLKDSSVFINEDELKNRNISISTHVIQVLERIGLTVELSPIGIYISNLAIVEGE